MISKMFKRGLNVRPSGVFKTLPKFSFTQKNENSSLFNSRDHEANKSKDSEKWLAEVQKDFKVTTNPHHLQFSRAPIMDNFGELALGEIPEPLKFVRPFEMTTLDNGIRVCTERVDSGICSVGAFVDAGSRYETPETSGTAHFLEHIIFKGTKNRDKSKFESDIENMGASLDAYTSREHTLFHMSCFKNDVKKCVDILGDILQHPQLSKNFIEQEKDTIKTELEESGKDPQETIMEAAHFNSFRDHMMGQPILGDVDNIFSVTQDMVKQYHATHYIGKNLVIVGVGNIDHKEFVDMVANSFGNLSKNAAPGLVKNNTDKPIYTPSLMFMRDDELYNSSVGVFYDAPHWSHEDYYAFMLLERIIGQYQMNRNGSSNLNDITKQYSMFEGWCGMFPDVTRGQAIYSPYKDCGLFGTFLYGNEVFTRMMAYTGVFIPASYGQYLNQVEVYRGRARFWQELLNIQSPTDIMQLIGPQILYLNRRVHRSEMAKRISFFDNNSLSRVYRQWLHDAEPSIVAHGPVEALALTASYKYFKINSYITTLNLTHSLGY